MTHSKPICIAGAGLVGPLLAYALRQRGYQVSLFEKRLDERDTGFESGRSINLVLTSRGINALREVGLEREVLAMGLPVAGRMMHSLEGRLTYRPYGRDESECNYALSRSRLNHFLMDKAEQSGVKIFFESELESLELEQQKAHFKGRGEVAWEVFFGCDGAASVTRRLLDRLGLLEQQVDWLGVDYKELFIPAKVGGEYALEKKALHIWPRGRHFLMALPNPKGSFTVTLYMPSKKEKGVPSFEDLKTSEAVLNYFKTYYPDSLPLISQLSKTFFENPQGKLGTIGCSHWQAGGQVALVGDAAHAIVPFFGQGMNCGFEDISYLLRLEKQAPGNWEEVLRKYEKLQRPNANAIAKMAVENFEEMAEKVAQRKFLLQKEVEAKIEEAFPQHYRSRYGMVMYTLIPYALAFQGGSIQEEILDELCSDLQSVEQLDLKRAHKLIEEKFSPFLKKHNLTLERFR